MPYVRHIASGGSSSSLSTNALSYAEARRTTGDFTLPNYGGVWGNLFQTNTTDMDLTLAASATDVIHVFSHFMTSNPQLNFFDIAVLVSGVPVKYVSSRLATPSVEGMPGFYNSTAYRKLDSGFSFPAESSDISGGNITLRMMATTTAATGTLYASTNFPFQWSAVNYG